MLADRFIARENLKNTVFFRMLALAKNRDCGRLRSEPEGAGNATPALTTTTLLQKGPVMANQHTTPAHGIQQLGSCGNYNPAEIRLLWETRGRIEVKENGCWIWQGGKTKDGYGLVYMGNGKTCYAHRFAFERCVGKIPDGLKICHNCPGGDNPSCVNPAHFFLGTQADNLRDMVAKGRGRAVGPKGEAAPSAKMTDEKVLEIRRRWPLAKLGEKKSMAEELGIHYATLHRIATRRTWRHLP